MKNEKAPKKTVGHESYDLLQKQPDSRDPIELERYMQEDYYKYLIECIISSINDYPGPFFIVVLTKNERLMPNVFRNYFLSRSSCPTPDYDQTVFRYDPKEDLLEYVWTIPSRDACMHLKENALNVTKEEKMLLNYVLDFADGTLFKIARHYNNEHVEA